MKINNSIYNNSRTESRRKCAKMFIFFKAQYFTISNLIFLICCIFGLEALKLESLKFNLFFVLKIIEIFWTHNGPSTIFHFWESWISECRKTLKKFFFYIIFSLFQIFLKVNNPSELDDYLLDWLTIVKKILIYRSPKDGNIFVPLSPAGVLKLRGDMLSSSWMFVLESWWINPIIATNWAIVILKFTRTFLPLCE